MRRQRFVCAIALATVALTGGCNIFEFAASGDTADEYIAEGMQNLWDGRYPEAETSFTNALEKDPGNAEALWGRAKARLRGTGFTAITLLSEISNLDPISGGEIPFMNETEWPDASVDRLLHGLSGVFEDLTPLYRNEVVTSEYTREQVRLDYAATLAVLGVLNLRDTDGDGRVTADDVNLDARFDPGGQLVLGDAWNDLSTAEQVGMVDRVDGLLEDGSDVMTEVLADYDIEGVDMVAVQEAIDQIAADLRGYNGK